MKPDKEAMSAKAALKELMDMRRLRYKDVSDMLNVTERTVGRYLNMDLHYAPSRADLELVERETRGEGTYEAPVQALPEPPEEADGLACLVEQTLLEMTDGEGNIQFRVRVIVEGGAKRSMSLRFTSD